MKKGDRIRIIRMDDAGGKDWQAARMNGVVATVDYWSRLPQAERLQAQVGGLTREGLKTEVIRTEVLAGWIGVEEDLLVPEEHNGISFYTAEDPEQGLYWVGLDNGIIIMALTTTEGADAVREMLDSLSAVQR